MQKFQTCTYWQSEFFYIYIIIWIFKPVCVCSLREPPTHVDGPPRCGQVFVHQRVPPSEWWRPEKDQRLGLPGVY